MKAFIIATMLLVAVIGQRPLFALEDPSTVENDTGVIEHLDQPIDLTAIFTDSAGQPVQLKDLMLPARPMLIVPVYYSCPRLCSLVFNGLSTLFNDLGLKLGSDFTATAFSINPREGSADAAKKAKKFRGKLSPAAGNADGWHFLTADQPTIERLTSQLGFKYKEDEGEYAHSAAFMLITPEGKISRYFYGVTYDPSKVRYALIEASAGHIGNSLDKVFLYCFRYDHTTGKYTPLVMNLVRVVSGGVAILLFLSMLIMRLREKHA